MRPNIAQYFAPQNSGGNDPDEAALLGISIARMLEQLLPETAEISERKSIQLQKDFTALIDFMHLRGLPTEGAKTIIGRIVTEMQFQDRQRQIMTDAASILQRYREMLADMHPGSAKAIAKQLVNVVCLSDIRGRLTEALAEAKLMAAPPAQHPQKTEAEEDTELF
jgi:hypothetical protein